MYSQLRHQDTVVVTNS